MPCQFRRTEFAKAAAQAILDLRQKFARWGVDLGDLLPQVTVTSKVSLCPGISAVVAAKTVG